MKNLILSFMVALTIAAVEAAAPAEPVVKRNVVTFESSATVEQIAAAKAKIAAKDAAKLKLVFKKTSDEATVLAAIGQFPDAVEVTIDEIPLASLEPLAKLGKVKTLSLRFGKDLDFTPIANLPKLQDLSAYGATVKSFAPLATCPKLKSVMFYSVKGPQSLYDSLGALKQVKNFIGGYTPMTSIEWMREVPQAEEISFLAEEIADLLPLQSLANLKCVKFSGMSVGDLAILSKCTKLTRVDLPNAEFANTMALATLPKLTDVNFIGAKSPVDVSFAAKCPNLKRLNLWGCTVENGATLKELPNLKVSTDKKTVGL
jgi:Leucine-rich repeat (LRR) protein